LHTIVFVHFKHHQLEKRENDHEQTKYLGAASVEKNNYVQVLTSFFECYHLHEARQMLEDIKQATMKEKFSFREFSREEANYKFFFERLERLLEAAHVMIPAGHDDARQ
jgi:hypothetical protein